MKKGGYGLANAARLAGLAAQTHLWIACYHMEGEAFVNTKIRHVSRLLT